MGVYITGMEMPKNCWDCEVGGAKQMDNAACPFYSMEFWEQENHQDKIADDCPLVPVPKHGDLIDREYAIGTACSGRIRALPTTEDGEDWIRVEEVRESIKSAPTIIPAEEDE